MFERNLPPNANVIDHAAAVASSGIAATQHALNGLDGSVQSLRDQVSPRLDGASEQAGLLVQRGVDALRDGSQNLRDKAHQASTSTTHYIQQEPMKSVLIAAAAGAGLMALISLLSRPRRQA